MSRRTILILLALIIIALGAWVYISSTKTPANSGEPSSNPLSSLFPFSDSTARPSQSGEPTTSSPDGEPITSDPEQSGPSKRLVQVTKKFTAGFTVLPESAVATVDINDTTGTQQAGSDLPMLRFAERGTGYIYDIDAKGKTMTKSSGTVIAHTLAALFGDDGNTVIFRYIKNDNVTIATYLGRIVPPTDANSFGTIAGSFLTDGISDLVLSSDKKNILYMLPTAKGVAGMTMKTDGSAKKQIFSSAFTEWLLDWPKTGAVTTTKAAASVPGYVYSVTSAGVFTKLLGPVNGLTTKISPDGKTILYSVSKNGSMSLRIRRLKDNTDSDTGLATLPEKCGWNAASTLAYCGAGTAVPAGEYPEAWYQGSAHFNDALWKVDAATGTTTEINTGEGNYLDVTNVTLDSKEKYLFFINKNDSSLWSFDLTPPATPVIAAPALPSVQ
jgi:hypothetical protein